MYCANRRKQPQPPKEKADSKERRRGFFAPILLLAALVCFLLFRVGQNVQPTLNALAGYECRSSCLEIINQSVQDVLAREPELCRGLYVYDRDDDGTILAVRADPQAMSRVQLRLTQEVIDRLGARKSRSVRVPVGTLLGWKVLAERGPCISYRYLQDAYVTSSVNTRVSHTGINQTELDVSIAFQATMAALFGNAVTQVEVEHELLLAQILLVGQVPQVYAGADFSAGT